MIKGAGSLHYKNLVPIAAPAEKFEFIVSDYACLRR